MPSVPEAIEEIPESVVIDETGVVVLTWRTGARITGPAAQSAMEEVNRVCAGVRRPMLVNVAKTQWVTPEARSVWCQPCAASRIAILGKSPVDRVLANFSLGTLKVPCPTKFFTDLDKARAFLRETP